MPAVALCNIHDIQYFSHCCAALREWDCAASRECSQDAAHNECAARPQTQRLIYAQAPPFTMIHTGFTPKFYVRRWSQLAVSAAGSECSAPGSGIWSLRGLFPMQILIAWDPSRTEFHESRSGMQPPPWGNKWRVKSALDVIYWCVVLVLVLV